MSKGMELWENWPRQKIGGSEHVFSFYLFLSESVENRRKRRLEEY